MITDEQTELIKKAIDRVAKAMCDFYAELPRYLFFEMAHPKKKPRGTIRRMRRRKDHEHGERIRRGQCTQTLHHTLKR